MKALLLAVVGVSAGALVAGGVVALMVGLKIITRFIGISRTARHVKLFETFISLGGVLGSLMTVYYPEILLGWPLVLLFGLFGGIFVGGWIMALAELLSVFPVFTRRLNLTKGNGYIVASLALGKTLGSLLHFYYG